MDVGLIVWIMTDRLVRRQLKQKCGEANAQQSKIKRKIRQNTKTNAWQKHSATDIRRGRAHEQHKLLQLVLNI